MLDFAHRTEATINADPKVVFDIVSDPGLHAQLAGSGELNTVKEDPPGPIGLGSRVLVEETLKLTDGTGLDLSSVSVVVAFDPPNCLSWVVGELTLPEQFRRLQWWFTLRPAGPGTTHVVHEVELDIGDPQTEMVQGVKAHFEDIRAPVVRAGMERTLENLRALAEQ